MDHSTFENDLKCTSPERNCLQNCFLDTEFQKLVMKKCIYIVPDYLSCSDINKFYETELIIANTNGAFTLNAKTIYYLPGCS
jgi:hypothetical protein